MLPPHPGLTTPPPRSGIFSLSVFRQLSKPPGVRRWGVWLVCLAGPVPCPHRASAGARSRSPRLIFGLAASSLPAPGRFGFTQDRHRVVLPHKKKNPPPRKQGTPSQAAAPPTAAAGGVKAREGFKYELKVRTPTPDEPPVPAAPSRLRPGETEAQRRAEAAQASPADRRRGAAAGLRGDPRPHFPPLPLFLPPLPLRCAPANRRPAAPPASPGRETGVGGAERYLAQVARLLRVAAAQHPLELVHTAHLGPHPSGSAALTAGLPCPSPPQGLPAPACTAPRRATCARQVDEGRWRRRRGCRGM